MPRGGMENTLWCPCGMRRPCAEEGGACPTTGGRKYLGGMPDATVEILGKSYDAGIPRELARCHHMGPVGCGKSYITESHARYASNYREWLSVKVEN
jgi:hypothetical protein